MKITPDPQRADVMYLYYLFNSAEQLHYIRNSAIQTGVPHTNLGILRKTPVSVPSLAVQKGIAAALGALDDRIALLRETNSTLEAIAQALFKSWFVDFDPVRAKAEGRTPEGMDEATAAVFPSSFENSGLGLVPKGWTTCSIYQMATYINGAAYKAFQPNAERRGRPIIKIAELKAGVTTQTAFSDVEMAEKYLIGTGDILFSWSGNPDTSIDTFVWIHDPAWLNQHIFRVLPHASSERSFVLQLLRHLRPVFAELARNKQTTGLGHVTVADLKRLLVIKPNSEVLKQFDQVASPIQARIFANEQQAQTLTTLRDTLLPRLISGQLRLPEAQAMSESVSA
ncbi:MAG: restriction endonuclease subunit S [Burkholderiaceae bacterium]|nr:restriction endonuclease subunit S [Burkholderiaceae bacterium]